MKKHIVIPARLKSSRLPSKPLLAIHGKAMILWVIDRAVAVKQAGIANSVFVATDDKQIANICEEYCQTNHLQDIVKVVMTRNDHASGTDRLAEVAQLQGFADDDMVINMQGDEPLVPKTLIAQVSQLLADKPDCVMATLAEPIATYEEFYRPSVVKVVKDSQNHALYFSRSPIPCNRDVAMASNPPDLNEKPQNALRHLGLYAYKVALLKQFSQWQQGELEQLESLEQLRIMEKGYKIAIDVADENLPAGVDTQEDLDRLNAMDLSEFLTK